MPRRPRGDTPGKCVYNIRRYKELRFQEKRRSHLVLACETGYNESFAQRSPGRAYAWAQGQRQVHDKVTNIPLEGGGYSLSADHCAGLAPVWRLDDFVIGPENRQLLAAVESILRGESSLGQPTVFYGPSGCGKSHLARVLVQLWRQRRNRRSARYVTGPDFARHLAEAIDTKSTDEFRHSYRRLGLLVLDDVHLLQGRVPAQEELARTLDAVIESGGSAVLTASVAPERLDKLVSHLQSRLVGGLAIGLALPGWEARRAILEALATRRSMLLADEVLDALATAVRGSAAALAGALARLELAAHIDGQPPTVHTVQRVIKARPELPRPSIAEIALAAAKYFSLRLRDLRGPSRRQAIVTARDVAMYLARTMSQAPLDQIGRYFARRDHTTVAHACRKTERLLATDPLVRSAVDHLRERLERQHLGCQEPPCCP